MKVYAQCPFCFIGLIAEISISSVNLYASHMKLLIKEGIKTKSAEILFPLEDNVHCRACLREYTSVKFWYSPCWTYYKRIGAKLIALRDKLNAKSPFIHLLT